MCFNVFYEGKSFVDTDNLASITSEVAETGNRIEISMYLLDYEEYFSLLKVFEKVNKYSDFKFRLFYFNKENAEFNGAFEFDINNFDIILDSTRNKLGQIVVNQLFFDYNNKRVITVDDFVDKKNISIENLLLLFDLREI